MDLKTASISGISKGSDLSSGYKKMFQPSFSLKGDMAIASSFVSWPSAASKVLFVEGSDI